MFLKYFDPNNKKKWQVVGVSICYLLEYLKNDWFFE